MLKPAPQLPLRTTSPLTWALHRLLGFVLDLAVLILLVVISPWILWLVIGRRRSPGSLRERLGGWSISLPVRERIWVHAVSVGELRAVLPVLDQLRELRPGSEIVISTTTVSARDLARRSRPDLLVRLLPLDLGPCVRQVLSRLRPTLLVLVELELWPNLLLECHMAGVPVMVVNGRISDKGWRQMKRLRWLFGPMFRSLTEVLVRDEENFDRFVDMGVHRERTTCPGNLKFDIEVSDDGGAARERLDRAWGQPPGTVRWMGGCTHPGEEEILLDLHRQLLEEGLARCLVLAPRHGERAGEVLRLASGRGFRAVYLAGARDESPEVVVVDQVGVLDELYRASTLVFVGGSLVPHGGQNVLEAVAAGAVTFCGPHHENFREVVEALKEAGAIEVIEDSRQLAGGVREWIGDPLRCSERGELGRRTIIALGGASERSAERIAALSSSQRDAWGNPGSPVASGTSPSIC